MKLKLENVTLAASALAAALIIAAPAANANVDVGVGVDVTNTTTVYVPIRVSSFRIEPEIDYLSNSTAGVFSSGVQAPSTTRTQRTGVGLYLVSHTHESLDLYYGIRIGLISSRTSTTNGTVATNTTSSGGGHYYAPTIGAEYFFAKQVSLGFAASLTRTQTSTDTGTAALMTHQDLTGTTTETHATLRYYF